MQQLASANSHIPPPARTLPQPAGSAAEQLHAYAPPPAPRGAGGAGVCCQAGKAASRTHPQEPPLGAVQRMRML